MEPETPPRNYTDEQMSDLAYRLVGTCDSIETAGIAVFGDEDFDEDRLTQADADALDDRAAVCANCGWWSYANDMIDDLCETCLLERDGSGEDD